MKRFLIFLIFTLLFGVSTYAQESFYPEENKVFNCVDTKYPDITRELSFITVKKKKFSAEDLGKILFERLYIVKRKAEEDGKEIQSLHYALSSKGPLFFFTVDDIDETTKLLSVELFDNTSGVYEEILLSVDVNAYKYLKNHPKRIGFNNSEFEKVISLKNDDFEKELKNTAQLYKLIQNMAKLNEITKYMTYIQRFNCK